MITIKTGTYTPKEVEVIPIIAKFFGTHILLCGKLW